jgi:hypothetical protein
MCSLILKDRSGRIIVLNTVHCVDFSDPTETASSCEKVSIRCPCAHNMEHVFTIVFAIVSYLQLAYCMVLVFRGWKLGVVDTVRRLFAEPVFANHVGTARSGPTSPFSYPAVRRLGNSLGKCLEPDCSIPTILFEIGGDGVQIHTFGKRTVCVIGIRCLDLPQHLAHTAYAYQAVFIIEGNKEKKALSGVLEIITNEVMQHYPPAGALLSYGAPLCAQLPGHAGHDILLLAGGRDTTPLTVLNGHTRAHERIYLALGRATGDNPSFHPWPKPPVPRLTKDARIVS